MNKILLFLLLFVNTIAPVFSVEQNNANNDRYNIINAEDHLSEDEENELATIKLLYNKFYSGDKWVTIYNLNAWINNELINKGQFKIVKKFIDYIKLDIEQEKNEIEKRSKISVLNNLEDSMKSAMKKRNNIEPS